MAKKRMGDIAPGEENEGPEEEERAEQEDAEKPGEEAHGSEEKKEMKTGEEMKRGGRMKKRARGGHLDAAEEHKKEMPRHQKPHHPHHHPRKAGGKVPGKAAKHRPDRRARGGATSDLMPTTAAGNVSVPDYERQPKIPNGGGVGADMSPYRGGGHRRPG